MEVKHLHEGQVLGKLYLVTLESFELDESSDKLAEVHTVLLKGSSDSRLSIQGGHYSKITLIVEPLHITLHFLHLYP